MDRIVLGYRSVHKAPGDSPIEYVSRAETGVATEIVDG